MSTKYPGGIISKTAPTPSGPYADSTAPGIWTLEQQAYWQKLGQWPTQGNVNPSAFIENLFQTYLYTGNGSTQTITNGIDLSTKGGLVWIKNRSDTGGHRLFDTARGVYNWLSSNSTGAQQDASPYGVTAFNSNGFAVSDSGPYAVNDSGQTYASWTFRKQAKFFDVVTFTGPGVFNHSLGSVPGCVIIKSTSGTGTWWVAHRGANGYSRLNSDIANSGTGTPGIATSGSWCDCTSTTFDSSNFSSAGETCVAYLFAHDAGGFGLSGSDNVISCGAFTTNGSGAATITLGYEPQWILTKQINGTNSWGIYDTMRGWSFSNQNYLIPDLNWAEGTITSANFVPTATGFTTSSPFATSANYIYIAIRKGPMATPTVGTSVFLPVSQSTSGSYPRPVVTNFPVDFVIMGDRNSTWGYNWSAQDRLRGKADVLFTSATTSENTGALSSFAYNTQFGDGWVTGGTTGIYECFRRAPGFMDVVCYTGNGASSRAVSHNLGVAPEMMIVIVRNDASLRCVYHSALAPSGSGINLNSNASTTGYEAGFQAPSSSTFTVTTSGSNLNYGPYNYVAYLFATCAGVSKVGSYTGTGTTLQVNCGFTGGARFVMIKRTDSTGDWYVWDSARGIVAGNDPYLLLNSTAAEVTGTDYVDTYSAGFEISSTAPSAINASGGTFIFLAIA